MRRNFFAFCLSCFLLAPVSALAQAATADLGAQMKALQDSVDQLKTTVKTQQSQIETLQKQNAVLQQQMVAAPSPSAPPASTGATPAEAPAAVPGLKITQSTTPEIGVVVDVVGALTQSKRDQGTNDRLALRELELVFNSDIDPFTRLDTTISFSDAENPEIEEAYITYLGLPKGFVARVGRMRPRIGKESAMHRDQLDTVDEPLVIQRYLGEEGLFRTALEISNFLPQFTDKLTQEVSGGVMEGGVGDGGALFGDKRRVPSWYLHLKNYWEVSDTSNVEVGATYLRGSSDNDSRDEVNALGLDLTVEHFFSPIHKLKWQTEAFFQDRAESTVYIPNTFVLTEYNRHPWGFYSLVDYRLNARFGIGGRIDYVEPINNPLRNSDNNDKGAAAYLTYYQSEFARLRLQYEYLQLANGDDDNRLFLQGTYAIGLHKHKLN